MKLLVCRHEFDLWGGTAVVAVPDSRYLAVALEEVRRVVREFDDACSTFREDSELSRLNLRHPRGEPFIASELLFKAVRHALDAARFTDGAVDPTVGTALVAHRINPVLPGQPPQIRIEAAPGYAAISLDETTRTITLPASVQLDLGATAKAFAADTAATAAHAAAGCAVLVSLGGDIAVAGEAPPEGWTVRVTDDHRQAQAPGQTIRIDSGGLATSSITVRTAGSASDPIHHLLDPRTGRPADGPWRTVSVVATTCLEANTASTAAIVLGVAAPAWLEARGLHARLVSRDGRVQRIGDWPGNGEDLPA